MHGVCDASLRQAEEVAHRGDCQPIRALPPAALGSGRETGGPSRWQMRGRFSHEFFMPILSE
jgi:hypothetical protein